MIRTSVEKAVDGFFFRHVKSEWPTRHPSKTVEVQVQGTEQRPVYIDYNRFGSHGQVGGI